MNDRNRSEYVAHQEWAMGNRQPERLALPDDVEASNAIPPDASRTFRPPFLARRVSPWPLIIVVILSTMACAAIIGWFVSAALKAIP